MHLAFRVSAEGGAMEDTRDVNIWIFAGLHQRQKLYLVKFATSPLGSEFVTMSIEHRKDSLTAD